MAERKHLLTSDDFAIKKHYTVDDDDDEFHATPKKEDQVPVCCSYRIVVIVCCTLSMTITYASQASLSSAMVCMIEDVDVHPATDNLTKHDISELITSNETDVHHKDWLFTWDKAQQGLAISAFFMGYYVSQIPSNLAAARFGPKRVVVVSLVLISVFQFLAVPAAYYGIGYLYADRIIVGIINGFLYAPTFALAGQWAPRHETSLLFGIVGMGMELGNVLSYVTSLLACEIVIQEGWPFVFYILGGAGLIVAALFLLIVTDSPFRNRHISKKEARFIASCIPKRQPTPDEAVKRIPVKEILTSSCVWAIIVSQIGSDWLYYFFVTMEPTFLKDVIKLSHAEVNLLSGLPFLGIIPTIYLSGYLCDRLVTRGVISNTSVRKINDFMCKIIPSAILVGLGFLPQDSTAVAFVMNLVGAMFMGFSYVSWMANPVDLAPAYTGFIVGVCEIGAMWVAIAVPIVFDEITIDRTREEWQLVFYITAGIEVFCFLFYAFFASGEPQPWAFSTLRHEYDALDGHAGSQKPLLNDGAGKSGSNRNGSVDDESQNLFSSSLTLSLGGFRGTSSYEASLRRNQERQKLSGDVGSSTVVISGPALTSSQLHAGLIPSHVELGHNVYRPASVDAIKQGLNHPEFFIHNGAVIIPKVSSEGFFGVPDNELYIESDDDSWHNIASRSLPSNLTSSVVYGRGDHDIHSVISSPFTSGRFDDEALSGPPRNIKSLAAEIAEALSVHSLNDPDENGKAVTGKVRAPKNKKNEITDKKATARENSNNKRNNEKNNPSSMNIKYMRHGSHPSHTRHPQFNDENTSSIMVSSEDYPDAVETEKGKGRKSQKNKHSDKKRFAHAVKKWFSFKRSKSNPDLGLANEESFVFVTDEDIKTVPRVHSWVTKSFDNGRTTKQSSSQTQGTKNRMNNQSTNDDEDESVLFAQPFDNSKKDKT